MLQNRQQCLGAASCEEVHSYAEYVKVNEEIRLLLNQQFKPKVVTGLHGLILIINPCNVMGETFAAKYIEHCNTDFLLSYIYRDPSLRLFIIKITYQEYPRSFFPEVSACSVPPWLDTS
jgi:hypothetical protein